MSKRRWNIWDIRSPWLRIPLAWLLVPAAMVICFGVIGVEAVIGGYRGGVNSARRTWEELEWDVFWPAMSTWRTTK